MDSKNMQLGYIIDGIDEHTRIEGTVKVRGTSLNHQDIIRKEPLKKNTGLEHPIKFRYVKDQDSETNTSTDGLVLYDIENSKTLKTTLSFASGRHTWEIIFPICINNVEFGVKSESTLKTFTRKFKTTTPRFVAITLDVEAQTLSFRLNKDSSTDKCISITSPGPYVPYVSTQKAEVLAVLNPYPRLPENKKLLGAEFNTTARLIEKLHNSLLIQGIPRKFGTINDREYLVDLLKVESKQMEQIHLPRDESPMKALRGWAFIRLSNSVKNYQDWLSKNVFAEGRKLDFVSTQDMVKILRRTDLKGEIKHIQAYLHEITEHAKTDEKIVFDTINEFYQKVKEGGRKGSSENELRLHYIKKTDKLLAINKDGKARVAHRGADGQFDLAALTYEGFPKNITDSVLLSLSMNELETLFRYLDWSLVASKPSELTNHYLQFFKTAIQTFKVTDNDSLTVVFSVPVESSKAVIDDLLHSLSKLKLKRSKEFLELSVLGIDNPVKPSTEPLESNEYFSSLKVFGTLDKNLSVHDINSILNIIYKLDEQQWCKSVFGTSSEELVKLFTSVSRPYSAFDRLSTFVGQDKSLHSLAEYGYIYRGDEILQNIYTDFEIKTIKMNCHDKLRDSLTLSNNVNAALGDSLNYLPALNLSQVRKVITSPISDFVFTFTDKGVCKVYTVDLGLVHVGSIDFLKGTNKQVDEAKNNKKWIQQLISYEIENAKTDASSSTDQGLNIKKDELKPNKEKKKNTKPKPTKGTKFQTYQTKTVDYDEEDSV